MGTFLLLNINIKNPETCKEYKELVKPIAEKFGGVYLQSNNSQKLHI